MKYHITKNGDKIKLSDLELSHLENIIKMIERKSIEGITIRIDSSFSPEDFWYDKKNNLW